MVTEEQVMAALRPIRDPEAGIGIVDLGLIYGVEIAADGKKVIVTMTLTSPACPVGPEIVDAVQITAASVAGVEEAEVKMVWDPPWDPRTMASDDAKDLLGIW